jgi:hypothetical protein
MISKIKTCPKEMDKGNLKLLEQRIDQITIQVKQNQEVLLNKVDVLEKEKIRDHPYNQ